jgi:hypothetical protein
MKKDSLTKKEIEAIKQKKADELFNDIIVLK